MSLTPLPKNYNTESTFGNFVFTMPVRRKVSGGLIFLGLMWLAGIAFLTWTLAFSEDKPALDTYTIVILVVFGSIFLLRSFQIFAVLFKQLLLTEIVEVSYQSVKVRRTILGLFGLTREYESEFITGIRAVQPVVKKFEVLRYGLASVEAQTSGSINLVYKNKSVNLGFSLDYLEGRDLVETIYKSYPHYNR